MECISNHVCQVGPYMFGPLDSDLLFNSMIITAKNLTAHETSWRFVQIELPRKDNTVDNIGTTTEIYV